ncbi:dUTP diphosphatase [Candidatus Woesearchaeota archaeon]|nr:dUTP diphosphatase [Candidatus Woesearchaeota archaeon]
MKIQMQREDKEVTLPNYAHPGDAGLDLFSAESCVLKPGERKIVATGVRIALPVGYEAQVRPKSGLAAKHGISVVNTPGTIDAGYRGLVGVILINHGTEDFAIEKNMKIAQMVINKVENAEIEEVESLDDTSRGEGGFGSTGKN